VATNVTEQLRIPLAIIEPAPENPREDVGDLADLAASIKSIGVIEPIVVRKVGDKYAAITGSRRLAASKVAGVKDIPVRIVEMTDEEAAAAALVENLQRKDLNPIEEAKGYRRWLDLTAKKQKDLAALIGKAEGTIANTLRLLDLADDAQEQIVKGVIGQAHGLELLRLTDKTLAVKVIKVAVDEEKKQNAEGRAKLLPTVPLRLIAEIVDNTNKRLAHAAALKAWPEQVKRRKAELEEKGITVTWEPAPNYANREETPWLMSTILGRAPKQIAARIKQEYGPSWTTHEKDCGCNTVALTGKMRRYDEPPTLEVVDVCTNATAYKAWQRKSNKSRGIRSDGTPRKTKEQREKEAREQARERIGGDLKFERRELTPKSLATIKKLARKDLSSEAARLVLFHMTLERWWGGLEKMALWDTIERMPLAKVKQRIVGLAVESVVPQVYKSKAGYDNDKERNLPHVVPMLAKFHIKPEQADLLPKLEDAAKGKKAKAKR
jgi:ParB/RepB/Spo0J family partition protein